MGVSQSYKLRTCFICDICTTAASTCSIGTYTFLSLLAMSPWCHPFLMHSQALEANRTVSNGEETLS